MITEVIKNPDRSHTATWPGSRSSGHRREQLVSTINGRGRAETSRSSAEADCRTGGPSRGNDGDTESLVRLQRDRSHVHRARHAVKDQDIVVVGRRLLQKPHERTAEVYHAARLFELLPQQPNDLWQMDFTYIHIPGRRRLVVRNVTVIDYYSRYLLACHLTFSYSPSEVMDALKLAGQSGSCSSGRTTGETAVPGNRQRTVLHCSAVHRVRP